MSSRGASSTGIKNTGMKVLNGSMVFGQLQDDEAAGFLSQAHSVLTQTPLLQAKIQALFHPSIPSVLLCCVKCPECGVRLFNTPEDDH